MIRALPIIGGATRQPREVLKSDGRCETSELSIQGNGRGSDHVKGLRGLSSRTFDRCRSISTQQDRYDVVSLSRICRVALNRRVRGKLLLPPLPTVEVAKVCATGSPHQDLCHNEGDNQPTPKTHTTSSTVTMARGVTTLQACCGEAMCGSPAANIQRRTQGENVRGNKNLHHRKSRPANDNNHETVENFCSLPLPEELLPMDDAPIDIYRSIVLIKEHRSEQLSQRQ